MNSNSILCGQSTLETEDISICHCQAFTPLAKTVSLQHARQNGFKGHVRVVKESGDIVYALHKLFSVLIVISLTFLATFKSNEDISRTSEKFSHFTTPFRHY